MQAPRVQYAKTSDGVSIAFATSGDGPPFLHTPSGPFHHLQLEWQFPEIRSWYESLSEKRKLVLYNNRGSGLSERSPDQSRHANHTLDANLRDLEAVADKLGPQPFVLFGFYHGGPAAIAYAAEHPERVSHLILWHTWARARDRFSRSPRVEAVRLLLDQDWELYTETLAHDLMGWPQGEPAHRFAAFIRECLDQETQKAMFRATDDFDVTDLLPRLKMPTLVLHRRQFSRVPLDLAMGLASAIPDARLVVLDGASWGPYLGDPASALQAIDDFLGDSARRQGSASALGSQSPESQSWEQPLIDVEPGRTEATMTMVAAREKSFSSGRYVVRRVLGEGGQKIVYLVHDTALDRECALSVIKRDLLEPDDLLRLQREAQSM
nr:alpha/beta fold hydrolase [Chloroflexota bacterium]